MSKSRDRWGEDEDFDSAPPKANRGGMSRLVLVLLIVGGVFLVILLGCGGLMFVGFRKAHQAEQDAMEAERADRIEFERAEEEERLARNIIRRMDEGRPDDRVDADPPAPKVGFKDAGEPPPQPQMTKFDDKTNHWRVLFRSKKPELWNTNTQAGDDFAIPVRSTPEGTKYLRLRRMDTGDTIIIAMTRGRIGRADQLGQQVRWNGGGNDEYGGYHLGIAEGPVARFTEGKGTIGVLMDGWDANPGSGFGHAHHIDNGGQRFSWLGKEIDATVFEIAVTTTDLTVAEKKLLR